MRSAEAETAHYGVESGASERSSPMIVRHILVTVTVCIVCVAVQAQDAPSYHGQVAPLLQARCAGCHHPGKLKGKLDVTSLESLLRGGKRGLRSGALANAVPPGYRHFMDDTNDARALGRP